MKLSRKNSRIGKRMQRKNFNSLCSVLTNKKRKVSRMRLSYCYYSGEKLNKDNK